MKFQIIDENGNVVDKNLSYEDAMVYIDNSVEQYYIVEPMEEGD